ncbi:hypothetical protein GOODEAATRI_021092 [Goodea atripinnis]|uniref:Uncharacterized protein n=1 Tax=Goodea atripinnis TaxID=208336 RepID=A0ABV0NM16_9TELE
MWPHASAALNPSLGNPLNDCSLAPRGASRGVLSRNTSTEERDGRRDELRVTQGTVTEWFLCSFFQFMVDKGASGLPPLVMSFGGEPGVGAAAPDAVLAPGAFRLWRCVAVLYAYDLYRQLSLCPAQLEATPVRIWFARTLASCEAEGLLCRTETILSSVTVFHGAQRQLQRSRGQTRVRFDVAVVAHKQDFE